MRSRTVTVMGIDVANASPPDTRGTGRRLVRASRAAIALAALAAWLAVAGAASADSLVFIKDHNVWLANPDGSGQYQVTLDGTAAFPYQYPSQADDGTIVAVRATAGVRPQLYRMRQNGELLNPPINTPAPGTGAIEAKVSPDGRLVAYGFATTVNDPWCAFCVSVSARVLISYSDRFTAYDAIGTPNAGGWPSWIGNDTLVMAVGSAELWYYRLGMPMAAAWFADYQTGGGSPIPTLLDAEVSPNGARLAVVRGNAQETIALYATTGVPPALPEPFTSNCSLNSGSGRFTNPTWTTDGGLLAVANDAGIIAWPLPTLTACGQPALVIPGGSEPDLSPAAISPGARPGCGNPGNPTPCGGTTPPACGTAGAPPCDTTPQLPPACGTAGAPPCAPPADTTPPDTVLTSKPAKASHARRVTVAFRSTERGSRFRCKLDAHPWVACRSPFRHVVGVGRHVIRVQAIDAAGNRDRTPAVWAWQRRLVPR